MDISHQRSKQRRNKRSILQSRIATSVIMFRSPLKNLRNYTLTLSSRDEPGNTASNFMAWINPAIHLVPGLYDIGLLSLQIKHSIVPSLTDMMVSDDPVGTLFPELIEPRVKVFEFTLQKADLPHKVMKLVDDWAQKTLFPLRTSALFTEDGRLLFHITNTGKKGECVIIPKALANLFGLRNRYPLLEHAGVSYQFQKKAWIT